MQAFGQQRQVDRRLDVVNVTRWMMAALLAMALVALAGCGATDKKESANAAPQSEDQQVASDRNQASEEAQSAAWTVQHEMGTLDLVEAPQTIVVLDTYLLDIALALGLQPVGVATESADQAELPGYLQEVVDFPFTWVGARTDPNLEAIANLEPDLIIADLFRHKEGYESLRKIAPTLVVTGSGADDWKHIIGKLGEATNRTAQAEAVITEFNNKLDAGKAMLSKNEPIAVAPMTLYPQSKVRIYTSDSFTGSILQGIGLDLPFEAGGEPFAEVSVEALSEVEADAFVLLQSPRYTQDVIPEQYPIFKDLAIVQDEQAYTVSMEQWAFYRGPIAGGVIMDEALEIFAK